MVALYMILSVLYSLDPGKLTSAEVTEVTEYTEVREHTEVTGHTLHPAFASVLPINKVREAAKFFF